MTAEDTSEPVEPNRDKVLRFRVTGKEKNEIEAKAKEAGYTKTSDYLREVGRGAEIKQRLTPELRKQLVGIGNNLNQIARRANSNTAYVTDEKTIHEVVAFLKSHLA